MIAVISLLLEPFRGLIFPITYGRVEGGLIERCAYNIREGGLIIIDCLFKGVGGGT